MLYYTKYMNNKINVGSKKVNWIGYIFFMYNGDNEDQT